MIKPQEISKIANSEGVRPQQIEKTILYPGYYGEYITMGF
jgi:hypothetical protein